MMMETDKALTGKLLNAAVIIGSLGYLVDMFDFFLFNIVRGPSLKDLGLSGIALTDAGLLISNFQMAGILIGGYTWGVLGDKFGRKSSLFASILVYSLATLGCSFVQDVHSYGALRFLAGFGVAGELGAGVALIAERLHAGRRGLGIVIFISTGMIGIFLAVLLVELTSWRTAYLLGGVGGLILLIVRSLVTESSLYAAATQRIARRGGLKLIWNHSKKIKRYLASVFVIAPFTFAPQILWTLAPELALARGIEEPIKASIVLAIGFFGGFCADFIAVLLSERLRSRKRALFIMLMASIIVFTTYLLLPIHSKSLFLAFNFVIGLTMGCWVLGITMAAEQFGTNIRATVASTVPSLSRGLTIPMNLAFMQLKFVSPTFAAAVIGCIILLLACWGWRQLQETYGRNLDYVED